MIVIDTLSYVPAYEQIRAQVAQQIADGALRAGTPLPTVRRLAADLGLATNTVARAYRELEAAGLILTAGRRGTTVAAHELSAHDQALAAARDYLDLTTRLGISHEDSLRAVAAAAHEREDTRRREPDPRPTPRPAPSAR